MVKIAKIIVCFLFLISQEAIGQKFNFDSLWSIWKDTTLADTTRLLALQDIAWDGYLYSQPDSAFYFSQLQYEFAEERGLKDMMSSALNTQGGTYWVRGDYDKALEYFQKSLDIDNSLGDSKGVASALDNIGIIYAIQGNYSKAIEILTRSLKIAEEIGSDYSTASTLTNIGNIYRDQGDYKQSLKYLQRSLEVYDATEDRQEMATCLNNIGGTYFELGDYQKAMDFFLQSLGHSEAIDDLYGASSCLNDIGALKYKENQYDTAMYYFEKAKIMTENIGDKVGQAISLNGIGNIFYTRKNYTKSIAYISQGLALAQEVGHADFIRKSAKSLYKSYKANGNTSKALEMHELYITTRDSMESEANQKEILRQEYDYNYEKQKALDDSENEKKLAIEHKEKEKKQVIIYAISIGLGFVVVFLIFIFNRLKISNRQKTIIENQKHDVEVAHENLEEKNKEILDSINYAKNIQAAVLPSPENIAADFEDSFILYKPRDVVSGDFYWHNNYGEAIAIAVADCTGHGVPGGFMSMMGSELLNQVISDPAIQDPAAALAVINKRIIENLNNKGAKQQQHDGMDIVLCFFWPEKNLLMYAGANNSLIRIRKGKLETFSAARFGVGGLHIAHEEYPLHSIDLEKGDCFYLLTDGYVDQFGGPKGKKFNRKQLYELINTIAQKPMDEQERQLNKAFTDWKGNTEQIDDVCILGLRV